MKKLLFLFVLLSFSTYSQTSVNIVDANSNLSVSTPLNVGDSSYIGVDYSHFSTDSFAIDYFNSNTPTIRPVLCVYKVSDLINLPYYSCAYGHSFKIKFAIPNEVGGTYFMGVKGYGNCDNICFTGNYCYSSVPFAINNPSGIETIHSKEDLISTEYFNLLGQPINKPEGIIVEIKTYRDGTKNIRKIIAE